MKSQEQDIFESDVAFISFGGSMLLGLGLLMLFLGLSCKFWTGLGICHHDLVSFPYLEMSFRREFISINLPLGMVIIGIGLQLFSKTGWIISLFILTLFLALFGTSAYILWGETFSQGWGFPYIRSTALNSSIFVVILLSIVFLVTKKVRKLYW